MWVGQWCTLRIKSVLETKTLPTNVGSNVYFWICSEYNSYFLVYQDIVYLIDDSFYLTEYNPSLAFN